MNDQNKIIENLIETLKDGQEGFKQAAESVKDPQLKSLFEEYSRQRARFAIELRSQAQSPDERDSKMSGSAAGALHRGWINFKSALTSGDDHAILANASAAKILRWKKSGRPLITVSQRLFKKLCRGNTPRSNRRMIVLSNCATLPKKANLNSSAPEAVASSAMIGLAELQRNLPHPGEWLAAKHFCYARRRNP
jgi:hypothetical protein